MNKKKYLIIADDFTGANDTGVQLRKNGYKTEVQLFPTGELIDRSVVLDTESRTISATDAFQKVSDLTKKITLKNKFDIVYKKIDSTIRGNIAEEIHAVANICQPDLIIVAPALPDANRTTVNGIQMLDGRPLMETDIANDPLNPLWTDNIVEILRKEFGHGVSLVNSDSSDLSSEASKVLVFDATTNADLADIVALAQTQKKRILYVGSAGLAIVLFKKDFKTYPSLAVVGSISETSLNQMAYAAKNGIPIVTIQLNDLLKPNRLELISKYRKLVTLSLNKGVDTILTVTRKKEDYHKTVESFKALGKIDRSEISKIVRENLAAVASEVVKHQYLSGLFLTGGDTAIEMIRALNASGSEIKTEIMPGVVLGTLIGGPIEGLKIVTKAGAFGQEEALYQSLKMLSEGEQK